MGVVERVVPWVKSMELGKETLLFFFFSSNVVEMSNLSPISLPDICVVASLPD